MRWFHPRREGQRFSLPATANATQEPHTLSKESRSRDSFPESRGAAVRMGAGGGKKGQGRIPDSSVIHAGLKDSTYKGNRLYTDWLRKEPYCSGRH